MSEAGPSNYGASGFGRHGGVASNQAGRQATSASPTGTLSGYLNELCNFGNKYLGTYFDT